MTLVPIIYTSLIIFATLLTTVIIFSYIAFKIKGGNRIPHSTIETSYTYTPRPVLANATHASKRVLNQRAEQAFKTVYYQSPSAEPSRVNARYNTERSMKQVPNKSIQNVQHSAKLPQKPIRKSNQEDRLEIMNNSDKYKRTSEFDDMPVQSNGTISDSNLLNFYSDRTDQEFTVMNASYYRKAL